MAMPARKRKIASASSILNSFYIIKHPLVRHKITYMLARDKKTDERIPPISSQQFYRLMKEVGMLLAYEVTRDLPTALNEEGLPGDTLAGPKPVIVPILRSGLAVAEGFREVMPSVRTGHLGLLQNKNHQPTEYLIALPGAKGRVFIVVDAIIATGGVAKKAVRLLVEHGVAEENIRFAAVLATEKGVQNLLADFSKVRVYAGELGKLIGKEVVPGFGDIGNRLFFGSSS